MTNSVQLNNVDHADLRVVPDIGAGHGAAANLFPVFPTEFEEAQRDYPILFRHGEGDALQAVVLTGLDRDENLFLTPGGWIARYVPAVLRRGPFSIGVSRPEDDDGPGAPMIQIDLDDPRVGSGDGEPLFLPHGGNAPYLEHVAGVLRVLYAGIEQGPAMFAAFEAHGLIQPVDIELELDEVQRYSLPDFLTIDQDRLAALDGAALAELNAAGHLRLAMLAAASLPNVNRLIALKNARAAA